MDNKKSPINNGNERNEKGQFVEGNTASVGHGRPKNNISIADMLRETGRQNPETETKTRYELLAIKLWDMALDGNIRAIDIISNRLEGRPAQQIKLEAGHTKSPYEIYLERLCDSAQSLEEGNEVKEVNNNDE